MLHPLTPINPISIIGAFVTFDFDVSEYGHIGVGFESVFAVAEKGLSVLVWPIAPLLPAGGLMWMAAVCPLPQLGVEFLVQCAKQVLGDTGAVVIGPASNNGIEGRD